MYKHAWMLAPLTLFALAGCDNDPAAGKTRAEVKEAVAAAEAPASAVRYAFSNEGSAIEFVGAKVTGKHDGKFERFEGAVDLVEGDPSKSRVSVEIEAASIVADAEKLTHHLKSADFFDVERFPTAKFVSTAVEKGGAGDATHTVTGNLTLHGVTKAITFPAEIALKSDRVEVGAEFAINRKDFGIVYPGMPDDLIKDEVLIKLDVAASKR
jgi:polyisoprenoid-binding protein YceI